MANENPKKVDLLLAEIIAAERKRAAAVMQDATFADLIKAFRKKFIVNGFLMPLYAFDGKYSISHNRVTKFGDYILPLEMEGKVFNEIPKASIRAEEIGFWWHVTEGLEVIPYGATPLKNCEDTDIPAKPIWQEIVTIGERLKLFGEAGGGILITPQDMDADYLTQSKSDMGLKTGEDGYTESYKLPAVPRWITKFHLYNQEEENPPIEVRPPWYHLVRHAFYNVPINRLPVFCAVLNSKGRIDAISFPASDLSSNAREYIGGAMLKLPEYIKKHTETFSIREEQRDMVQWLWYKVGHRKWKKTLSYGQISSIMGGGRSSARTSISRFSKRLEKHPDGLLLGRLLKMAGTLGLGRNQTYQVLAAKGLVPSREREIDDFDDLDKLI